MRVRTHTAIYRYILICAFLRKHRYQTLTTFTASHAAGQMSGWPKHPTEEMVKGDDRGRSVLIGSIHAHIRQTDGRIDGQTDRQTDISGKKLQGGGNSDLGSWLPRFCGPGAHTVARNR